MTSEKLDPPGAFENHCTDGAPQPVGVEAVALKDAACPGITLVEAGCASITGTTVQEVEDPTTAKIVPYRSLNDGDVDAVTVTVMHNGLPAGAV